MYEKPGLYKHWDFTVLDILILELSYFLALYLRHGSKIPEKMETSSYSTVFLLIIILVLVSGMGFHNYREIIQRGYWMEFSSVIQHVAIITAGLILYLFIVKDSGEFSRLVLGYFFIISIPLVYVERILYKKFVRKRNTTGYSRRNAVLITSSEVPEDRVRKLKNDVYGIVELTGIVRTDVEDNEKYCGIQGLGRFANLPDAIRSRWVDEIFVLLNDSDKMKAGVVLKELSTMGITLHFVLNAGDSYGTSKSIEKMGDTILLTESIRTITFGQTVAKRILDIIGAIIGLVITGILTVVIGPLIYKADPGPIFYKQKRIGRNGRVFNMYKFRSMYQDADRRKAELMQKNEMTGLMFKMKDDPRILGSGPDGKKHGIGWFIRTTSIDEFPQFFNVLIGQLSLVGTRPPTVDEWNKYKSHHRARMSVKPGITGLWQVSGRNNITDFEDVVKLDMEYIDNFSLAEDLKILFRTVKVVLKHEGAE